MLTRAMACNQLNGWADMSLLATFLTTGLMQISCMFYVGLKVKNVIHVIVALIVLLLCFMKGCLHGELVLFVNCFVIECWLVGYRELVGRPAPRRNSLLFGWEVLRVT